MRFALALLRAPVLVVALLLAAGVLLVVLDHDGQGGALLGAVVGFVSGQRAGVLQERRRAVPPDALP